MVFDVGEKLLSIGPVDNSMIKAQRKISQVANRDVVFPVTGRKYLGALFDFADAQNRDLRLIDYRRSEQAAKNSGIGDRKCSAGDLADRTFTKQLEPDEVAGGARKTRKKNI